MAGVLVSVALASYVALQAAAAGAAFRIVVPAAAAIAGVFAGFWKLAVGTLRQTPDLWETLPLAMVQNAGIAALAAALFTLTAGRLMRKIGEFRRKYPDR